MELPVARQAVEFARAAALGYADGQDEPGWAYDRTRVVLRAPQGGYALSEALATRGVDAAGAGAAGGRGGRTAQRAGRVPRG